MRPIVNLADLVLAGGWLQPANRETLHQVAELLGFEPLSARVEPTGGTTTRLGATEPPVTPQAEPTPLPAGVAETPAPTPAAPRPTAAGSLAFRLEGPTAPATTGKPPAWYVEVPPLPPTQEVTPPPPAPLLVPQWTRTTLTSAVSVPVPEGRVDVSRLAGTLARLQLPRTIPREPVPTLRRGAQVLVDLGDAMLPYRQDQRRVVRELHRLIGTGFFTALQYRGAPGRGVQPLGSREPPQAYVPPPSGTPVFVLGDLGMVPQHFTLPAVGVREWQDFASQVRDAGCRLVAYVPYGPARWPSGLRGMLSFHYWGHQLPQVRGRPAPPLPVGEDENAQDAAALAAINPYAFELARLLSLASRIELDLLRAARLTLLPQADAGAEADLWFSALVEYQAGSVMGLRAEAAEYLRQSLKASGRLDEAWRFLARYRAHTGASATIRLEEQVLYLVTRDALGARPTVERKLSRLLATLRAQPEDRYGLALWSLEALASMPPVVQTWQAARDLIVAASLRLATSAIPADALPKDPAALRWLLPADMLQLPAGQGATIGVRLQADGLVFDEPAQPGDQPLRDLPPTLPRVLTVTWHEGRAPQRQVIQLYPEQATSPIDLGGAATAMIELINGQRFTLLRELDVAALVGAVPSDQVETLDLAGQGLSEVPPAVFDYPNLRRLDLRGNQIRKLPVRIGKLHQLNELWLDDNPLRELPRSIFKNLFSLRVLSLRATGLSELPVELENLSGLVTLDLAENQFGQFPYAVTRLRALRRLDLASNAISKLPAPIKHLVQLEELILDHNKLTALPPVIGSLKQLKELRVAHNELHALPDYVRHLLQLQTLDVAGNLITTLPTAIGQLVSLRYLNLADNRLTELPHEMGQLMDLTWLDLQNNRLTHLPEALTTLGDSLEYLDLRSNLLPLQDDLLARVRDPQAILEAAQPQARDSTDPSVMKYLRQVGLDADPFAVTVAEHEPDLPAYFVDHQLYDRILRSQHAPRSMVIAGDRGSGKSAIRLMVTRSCLPHNPGSYILAVQYTEFGWVRETMDRSPRKAILHHHLDSVLEATVEALVDSLISDDALARPMPREILGRLKWFWQTYGRTFDQPSVLYDRLASTHRHIDSAEFTTTEYRKFAAAWELSHLSSFLEQTPVWESASARLLAALVDATPDALDTKRMTLASLFRNLVGLAESIGLYAVYILVDWLEESYALAARSEQVAEMLGPLVAEGPLMETPGAAFKLFVPLEVARALAEYPGVRTDRLEFYEIVWTHDMLVEMLRQRLFVFSRGRIQEVEQLCGYDLAVDIMSKLVGAARGIPRNLLRITRQLVVEHCRLSPHEFLIQQTDWEATQRAPELSDIFAPT